jgi:hypothetical protein
MNRRPAESRRSPAIMKDEDSPIIPVRVMAAIQRKQPMPIGRNRLEALVRHGGPVGGFLPLKGRSYC